MDYFKLDPKTVDNIAYKAAKIVINELRKKEQPEQDLVSVREAARMLGVSEDYLRRIKDRFPHVKSGDSKQGRILFVKNALIPSYIKAAP